MSLELLTDVLTTRLRYIVRWDSVSVEQKSKKEIEVVWYNSIQPNAFEKVVYPVKELGEVIKRHKRKLLRDIPENEKVIYKEVLKCK